MLLARIRALLRRSSFNAKPSANPDSHNLCIGELCLSLRSRDVYLSGNPVELGDNEFDLLALLMNNAGKVLSRDHLLGKLRGIDYDGLDRSVDLGVSRLRRKLGATEKRGIRTVRGKGYLLVAEHW